MVLLQDGIALTSPPCNKKTDQRSNGKMPRPFIKHVLRNGRRKNKKNGCGATLIIRKEMAEHVSSTMHVFRGEKYCSTSGWPDPKDRKGNGHQKYYLTVNAIVTGSKRFTRSTITGRHILERKTPAE